MLLRSLDAYGWCRDNAETLRRLYPRQALAVERPPRLVFIARNLSRSDIESTLEVLRWKSTLPAGATSKPDPQAYARFLAAMEKMH